jgi:hypothetical protein
LIFAAAIWGKCLCSGGKTVCGILFAELLQSQAGSVLKPLL